MSVTLDRPDTAPAAGEAMPLTTTISIDIGGTFTDCFVADGGRTASGKASTTRHRLAVGFNAAIAECARKLGMEADELVARKIGRAHV